MNRLSKVQLALAVMILLVFGMEPCLGTIIMSPTKKHFVYYNMVDWSRDYNYDPYWEAQWNCPAQQQYATVYPWTRWDQLEGTDQHWRHDRLASESLGYWIDDHSYLEPFPTLSDFEQSLRGGTVFDSVGAAVLKTHGTRQGFVGIESFENEGSALHYQSEATGYWPKYSSDQISVGSFTDYFGTEYFMLGFTAKGIRDRLQIMSQNPLMIGAYCQGMYQGDDGKPWVASWFKPSSLPGLSGVRGVASGFGGIGEDSSVHSATDCSQAWDLTNWTNCGYPPDKDKSLLTAVQNLHVEGVPDSLMVWPSGIDWLPQPVKDCTDIAALFDRAGAYGSTVWAVTIAERNVDSIQVCGCRSVYDLPSELTVIASRPAANNPTRQTFYRFDNVDTVTWPILWVRTGPGSMPAQDLVGPFAVSSTPPDWAYLENINGRPAERVPPPPGVSNGLERSTEIRFLEDGSWVPSDGGSGGDSEEPPTPDGGMIVVSTDPALLYPAHNYYQGRQLDGFTIGIVIPYLLATSRTWDEQIEDIRGEVQDVVERNQAYNAWCDDHGWPAEGCSPGRMPDVPYLLLVGDCNPWVVPTQYFDDTWGRCNETGCVSDSKMADFDGDWMEDAIVARIPCTSPQELANYLATATRYESGANPQALLLWGANEASPHSDARSHEILLHFDEAAGVLGYRSTWLRESCWRS